MSHSVIVEKGMCQTDSLGKIVMWKYDCHDHLYHQSSVLIQLNTGYENKSWLLSETSRSTLIPGPNDCL
jgi:hypothetical protein